MFYQGGGAGIPACKFISAVTVLLLTGAVFTFLPMLAQATTVAGRTAGTFAVSPSGAATYTIPIWAPPGPNGMQPNIVLAYNSQRGNGPVGVGWAISGLSSIYRCNLTAAQDAAPAPIALSTSDGYCMDGQRLRLTSGTYGVAGSTYQTEVANFINVTAYGAAGNGPSYWVAQDRNARSYTYGNGGSSQVLANGSSTAISWMLNEVSDPPGNTMTVAYSTTTGTTVPATISWTPSSHGSSTYNYTMTFAYGANVIPPQGYVGGTSFTNPNLLSSIAVAYSGTAAKTYYLTYTASSTTGRDTLTQVQECAGTGTGNCLLPTTVTYQAGAAGVGSGTTVSGGVEYVISTAFDFNGDGRNDLIGINSAGALLVAFGGATGYGTPVSAPSGASTAFGDVDGSGVAGILANVSGTWYYYKWNGSAFAGTSTGISVATAASPVLADVDGDGRADFVYTDSSGIVHVRLSTSTAGTVSFSSTDINTGVGISGFKISAQIFGSNRALHFWGAAQADLLGTEKTCAQYNAKGICIAYQYIYYALHFTGSTFSIAGLFPAPLSSPNPAVDFADYNDDGCTDILTATALLLSACNGTAPVSIALPTGVTAVGGMDWNGDGRRDVLVKQANGNLGVVLSTGAGLSSSVIGTSYSAASTSYTAAPNLTGDGQDGLIGWNGTSATYYLHNGPGAPPDLATSFTDGYGNYFDPTYQPMGTGPCYFRDGTPPPYPDAAYRDSSYLACSYTASDGAGGSYSVAFDYYDADTNLQGRGWQGFERVYSEDSRNNIVHMTSYSTVFPNTGVVTTVLDRQGDWTTYIRQVTPTLASLSQETLSSTSYQQRYLPWLTQSQVQIYELGGAKNGQLITTSTTTYGTPDSYGNFPTISVATQDNDTTSPYYGATWTTATTNTPDVDTTHWCLALLTESQVAYSSTLSGSGSVTRTKTFTPDTTNCRYTQIVTEPNSSQFKVTEALGYDSFGNVNNDSVTGVAMGGSSPATRTTQISWTTSTVTTGQFPMTVTDPSGAQTQYNYNFSYGLRSSATDANNLTTSWQYGDGFGRKTQENRPDGTYTTWTYGFSGTEGLPYQGLFSTYNIYASNGTRITTGNAAYDSVDRVRITTPESFSGGNNRTDTTYDSLGRVSQSSFPCTFSSWTTTCTYWTTNSYDVLNRLTQSQRPISSTNNNPQTTTYAYAGRTTTVTDPQSNARVIVRDVNGWLRQTKDPMGYSVTLAYDSAGSKTKVTDSLGNTLWSGTYNYGLAAYLATATDMDMGAWGFTVDALGEKTA
jgi:YD repeat-containing protein